MADLKDLQEMVKSGEFSKKLLEDEKFKTEIKKILEQEDGIEITDKDVPEIVEELAKSLTQNPNEKVLSEENLENISGGVSKARIIKSASTIGGVILGSNLSDKIYMSKFASDDLKKYLDEINKINSDKDLDFSQKMEQRNKLREDYFNNHPEVLSELSKLSAGKLGVGAATGYGSHKLADYLCKKFDIK